MRAGMTSFGFRSFLSLLLLDIDDYRRVIFENLPTLLFESVPDANNSIARQKFLACRIQYFFYTVQLRVRAFCTEAGAAPPARSTTPP